MAGEPKYRCGICGKEEIALKMVFSPHSRQRYCQDMMACERRRKRNRRKEERDTH